MWVKKGERGGKAKLEEGGTAKIKIAGDYNYTKCGTCAEIMKNSTVWYKVIRMYSSKVSSTFECYQSTSFSCASSPFLRVILLISGISLSVSTYEREGEGGSF